MRIAQLFFLFDFGGVETHIVRLANYFARIGHESHVIISHRSGRAARKLHPDVKLHQLPQGERLTALFPLLAQMDTCIVHVTNPNPFFVWACAMAGVKRVLNVIHSSVAFPFSSYCDHTICVSRYVRNLQSRFQNIHVIYNGVPLAKIASSGSQTASGKKRSFLLAEMRRPNKQLLCSLEQILPYLHSKHFDLRFWFVGIEGKSDGNVRYFGPVQDPLPLLAQADFLLHFPSHDALPLGLLEAMSLGVIPITIPVGGIAEIVRHGREGILLPEAVVREPVAAARAIGEWLSQFADHVEKLQEMRRNAILRVEKHFSLEKMCDAYTKLLGPSQNERGHRLHFPAELQQSAQENKEFLHLVESLCFAPHLAPKTIAGANLAALSPIQRGFLLSHFGRLLLERGDLRDAIRILEAALSEGWKDGYTYLWRGLCEKEAGNFSAATNWFEIAAERLPDELEPQVHLLEMMLATQQHAAGRRIAQRLSLILPLDHPMQTSLRWFAASASSAVRM